MVCYNQADMIWIWWIFLGLLASAAYASLSGAPWVPTWRKDIVRAKRLLALRPGETFVELGCGDGRVTCAVGQGTGVELSVAQWLAAQVRRLLTRSWNTRFVLGNAFAYDLRSADAVYAFLMPETYETLRPKLEAELKPGARVLTYVWPIQGWTPAEVDVREGGPKLYLYRR